jgi:methionyl-tRNA formyltransferase
VWAERNDISTFQPSSLKNPETVQALKDEGPWDLFIVAAYGKIIPQTILDIPKYGTLNVHPSLLPKFRGSSPIESAILSEETHTGVTIMQLDAQMDHGPVVAQRERVINDWPPKGSELTRDLAHFGGVLLAEIIPAWMNGLGAHPQDHERATFTRKIKKEDGLIDLSGDSITNYKKIRAFDEWPGAYFFIDRGDKSMRIRITEAKLKDGALEIVRVIPEGKQEMSYQDFLRGYQRPS